ncbi:hypothetical protein M0Q50_01305 [bacterium]|jgi:hypothetical protein|nr:hypothetical protein [bacterium]
MNKLDYTNVDNSKGYPFTIDDIRFMLGTTTNKGIYKSIDNIASSLGNNRVLSGCVATISANKWIVPEGWIILDGELLFFSGATNLSVGTSTQKYYFKKNTTTTQSNNKKYKLDNTDASASFTYKINSTSLQPTTQSTPLSNFLFLTGFNNGYAKDSNDKIIDIFSVSNSVNNSTADRTLYIGDRNYNTKNIQNRALDNYNISSKNINIGDFEYYTPGPTMHTENMNIKSEEITFTKLTNTGANSTSITLTQLLRQSYTNSIKSNRYPPVGSSLITTKNISSGAMPDFDTSFTSTSLPINTSEYQSLGTITLPTGLSGNYILTLFASADIWNGFNFSTGGAKNRLILRANSNNSVIDKREFYNVMSTFNRDFHTSMVCIYTTISNFNGNVYELFGGCNGDEWYATNIKMSYTLTPTL